MLEAVRVVKILSVAAWPTEWPPGKRQREERLSQPCSGHVEGRRLPATRGNAKLVGVDQPRAREEAVLSPRWSASASMPPVGPTVHVLVRGRARRARGPRGGRGGRGGPACSAPEAEEPTIVMDALDEEEDKPPQEVAGSVPVDVLVDCGLLDPAYAAQMYGSDLGLV